MNHEITEVAILENNDNTLNCIAGNTEFNKKENHYVVKTSCNRNEIWVRSNNVRYEQVIMYMKRLLETLDCV